MSPSFLSALLPAKARAGRRHVAGSGHVAPAPRDTKKSLIITTGLIFLAPALALWNDREKA
jgi:hypothetical protein